MPFVILAVVVALIVGLFVGSQLPWGRVPLTVAEVVIVLHDDATGFVSFDGQDGTQLSFRVQSVAWTEGGQEGEGSAPPCLQEGKKVAAEVGYRWVRLPDGGARPFPLWLAC